MPTISENVGKHLVVEFENKGFTIHVSTNDYQTFRVHIDGEDKHGACSAIEVMRVMSWIAHDDSVSSLNTEINYEL